MPDPAPVPVTPPEGKTTIDDKMFFEPTRLSYQSADIIADKIAAQVQAAAKGKTVVIAGAPLLADFMNLQAVYLVLRSLQKEYEIISSLVTALSKRRLPAKPKEGEGPEAADAADVFLSPTASAIAPATTLVSAALGLVSLFREDVEYHGLKTAVDPLAFELALASKVKAGGADKVFAPDFMAVPIEEDKKGSLQRLLDKVQTAKANAWAAVAPLIAQLMRVESELDQAAKDEDQERFDQLSAEIAEMRRDLQPVSEPLSLSDQRLAELQKQWDQVSEITGLSQLARLLRAEIIHEMKPLYLHAQVVSSGGHHRISRNLFRMLFLGDGLSFAGGAIARWALLENDGSVAKGGIYTVRLNSRFQQFAENV